MQMLQNTDQTSSQSELLALERERIAAELDLVKQHQQQQSDLMLEDKLKDMLDRQKQELQERMDRELTARMEEQQAERSRLQAELEKVA